MLVAALLWYLILCSVLMVVQYFVERHFGRGYGTAGRARQRLRGIEVEQGGRIATDGRRGTGTATEMVRAENVHKSFGSLEVLKGIDLVVRPGEVCCVLGPSGSGKSTFLRCINHLEKINAGRILVDGDLVGYRERGGKLHELSDKEVAAQRRAIGMVFQRFNLFPHMTVLENVMEAPCRVKRENKAGGPRPGARAAATGSAWPTRWTTTRASSPAASSSGWRSPGRWPCGPS